MRKIFFIYFFTLMFNTIFADILLQGTGNYIVVNQPYRINIEFMGTRKGNYSIEGLDNFKILGKQSSSQITIINFNKQSRDVESYLVQPLEPGTYTLRVVQGGESSNTITVTVGQYQLPNNSQGQQGGYAGNVLKGGFSGANVGVKNNGQVRNQNSGGSYLGDRDSFSITNNLDEQSIYFGEKIVYEERFRALAPLRSFEGKSRPDFGKLSWKDYTPVNADKTMVIRDINVNGRPGKELILFRGVIQGSFSGDVSVTTSSGEVTTNETFLIPVKRKSLTVKPLPQEGKPENFTEIVGALNIDSSWEKTELEVGKTALLKVKLSGDVNLEGFDKLGIKDSADYTVFETLKNGKEEIKNGKFYSEKEFEVAFIPKRSGEIKVDGIVLSYFNPKTGKYENKTISGKTLIVKDSPNSINTNDENKTTTENNEIKNGTEPKIEDSNKNLDEKKEVSEEKIVDKNETGIKFLDSDKISKKLNINPWYVGGGLLFVVLLILMLKKYSNKNNIFKKEENLLKELSESKSYEEFYENYTRYMMKTYSFNPKIHSETKLPNDELKKINRVVEIWKYKGVEFDKKEIIKEIKKQQ